MDMELQLGSESSNKKGICLHICLPYTTLQENCANCLAKT